MNVANPNPLSQRLKIIGLIAAVGIILFLWLAPNRDDAIINLLGVLLEIAFFVVLGTFFYHAVKQTRAKSHQPSPVAPQTFTPTGAPASAQAPTTPDALPAAGQPTPVHVSRSDSIIFIIWFFWWLFIQTYPLNGDSGDGAIGLFVWLPIGWVMTTFVVYRLMQLFGRKDFGIAKKIFILLAIVSALAFGILMWSQIGPHIHDIQLLLEGKAG
jgi:hypothetical protein